MVRGTTCCCTFRLISERSVCPLLPDCFVCCHFKVLGNDMPCESGGGGGGRLCNSGAIRFIVMFGWRRRSQVSDENVPYKSIKQLYP